MQSDGANDQAGHVGRYDRRMTSSRQPFTDVDKQLLLDAIGQCRRKCIDALRRGSPTSDIAKQTRALVEAIDNVAEAVIGNREHFWRHQH
jgi:hypothetical protein